MSSFSLGRFAFNFSLVERQRLLARILDYIGLTLEKVPLEPSQLLAKGFILLLKLPDSLDRRAQQLQFASKGFVLLL